MHRVVTSPAPGRLVFAAFVLASLVLAIPTARAAEDHVTAPEAVVRSAPFDIAPEVARVHAGDRLPADDQAQGIWRRVRLPDGRYGLLRDDQVEVTNVAPPVAAPASLPAPPEPQPTGAPAAQPAPPARPEAGLDLFGVMFEVLPVGTLRATAMQAGNASRDSVPTFAVAPFADIAVTPNVAVGLSPQVVFRVKAEGASGESSTELDFRGRATARLPLSPNVRAYGRLSPGYSIIAVPGGSNPAGFFADVAVGTEVNLLPRLVLIVDLGYQLGFQSNTGPDGTFDGTQYLHLGAGLAIAP